MQAIQACLQYSVYLSFPPTAQKCMLPDECDKVYGDEQKKKFQTGTKTAEKGGARGQFSQ